MYAPALGQCPGACGSCRGCPGLGDAGNPDWEGRSTPCANQVADATIAQLFRWLSGEELAQLQGAYLAARPNADWDAALRRPGLIAIAAVGGNDCKIASGNAGEKLLASTLTALLSKYGSALGRDVAQVQQTTTYQQVTSKSGNVQVAQQPTAAPGGVFLPPPAPSALSALPSWAPWAAVAAGSALLLFAFLGD